LKRIEWILGAALGLSVLGCGGDDSSDGETDAGKQQDDAGGGSPGADAGASDAGSTVDPAKKVGTFTVRLVAPKPASGGSSASEGFTSINGKVFDVPVPEEIVWDVDVEQSGCKLLKPRVPFCDPACAQGVCIEDDKCAPNAFPKSVGPVTFSGLKSSTGSADVKIDPISGSYSTPGDVMLAYPAFAEGDSVKLHAAGESGAAFDITAKGIAPLTLTSTSFPLKTGMPLPLAWKAPGKSDVGRISVLLDISHHGGTKDTGSLSIPADLITKLLKLGVAGFPTVLVSRVSSGSAQISAGKVELQIVADVEHGVEIDGLVSCTDDLDCPSKSCGDDLKCK
jgi:hypothetical protein